MLLRLHVPATKCCCAYMSLLYRCGPLSDPLSQASNLHWVSGRCLVCVERWDSDALCGSLAHTAVSLASHSEIAAVGYMVKDEENQAK